MDANIFGVPRVSNKNDFYMKYISGFLGNRALAWSSYDELLKSGYKGDVCIRGKKNMTRSDVPYNVPFERVLDVIDKLSKQGFSVGDLTFNQAMNDKQHLVLQGEVLRGAGGLHLHGTYVQEKMNLALRESCFDVSGLIALQILRQSLWESSMNDLEVLLDYYSGVDGRFSSVVEFSAYDVAVGDVPGRNMVVWEVRDY